MKNIFYKTSVALLLTAVIATGCKKDFLDVPAQGQLTKDEALTDPGAADKLVAGVYNSLYAQGTVGLKFVILADVTSDDADKGSTAGDAGFGGIELDPLTYNRNTGIFNDVWTDYYNAIARINQALEVLNKSTFDETIKKRLIGEVRFLRGYYYFNLVRIFGGVPKVTRVPLPTEVYNDEFQTRASKADIYALVEDDLGYAVTNLPMKNDVGAVVGRATKGAAQGILSKVYLYQQKWQQAYDASLAVMTSAKYNLVSDYFSNFREVGNNNAESIFEVQTGPSKDAGGGCNAISKNYSNFQAPRGAFPNQVVNGVSWTSGDLGFGLNTPSAALAAAYEAGDPRKNATIITISNVPTVLFDGFTIPDQSQVTNSRYNYKAYHSPFRETLPCSGLIGDKDNRPKNIKIMRYSEVLLINAEAATHVGRDALGPLTQVRSRATLTTSSATAMDIWKERRVELGMEADRFFDIVRTGQAQAVLAAQGKVFTVGKNEVFPIPQIQIGFSGGKLVQNPGGY